MMGSTAPVLLDTLEMEQLIVGILMSVLLELCVMRMQTVWILQAAMSVPAPLATLVMDSAVRTLMSVRAVPVMNVQFVAMSMGASHVSARAD
jgi:hypothetical protein